MARVVDIFEAAVRRGASSGQTVLDLLDRGESVFAALEREQPAFAAYRRERCERKTVSANGKVKKPTLPTIRAALAKPEDATGRATTRRTTELIEVACAALLKELHDPKKQTRQYLKSQDGPLAWGTDA